MFARLRWPAALAGAVICLLVGAAVALASPFSAPILRSPGKGEHVRAGRVTLIVTDPGVPSNVRPVYVTISSKRTLDKYGHLKINIGHCKRCDFVALHPRKGHHGQWTVTSSFDFPGYWAVTPGKYYWQASTSRHCARRRGAKWSARSIPSASSAEAVSRGGAGLSDARPPL